MKHFFVYSILFSLFVRCSNPREVNQAVSDSAGNFQIVASPEFSDTAETLVDQLADTSAVVQESSDLVTLTTRKMLEVFPGSIDTSSMPANPRKMIAVFEDVAMGDYFHLLFKDEQGKEWDFGNGDNQLSGFELAVDEGPNSKYKGKKFEVVWDSVKTKYTCCEGGMETVEGRVPTIIELKLLK